MSSSVLKCDTFPSLIDVLV